MVCKEGVWRFGNKNLRAFNLALLGKWVWRYRVEKDVLGGGCCPEGTVRWRTKGGLPVRVGLSGGEI